MYDAAALAQAEIRAFDDGPPREQYASDIVHVEVATEATRAEWRRFLRSSGTEVVLSHPGVSVVFLRLATPAASRAELDTVLAALEADPIIVRAAPDVATVPTTLPPLVDGTNLDLVEPHLVTRTPRLWDLRPTTAKLLAKDGVMRNGPDVLVIDQFGNGAPDPDLFEGEFAPSDYPEGTPGLFTHGYRMMSLMLPRYDESGAFGPDVEGIAGPITHPHPVWASTNLELASLYRSLQIANFTTNPGGEPVGNDLVCRRNLLPSPRTRGSAVCPGDGTARRSGPSGLCRVRGQRPR
ncbi:MAG: hypothetical protein AAGA48_18325 [Myxococcota bacterium]